MQIGSLCTSNYHTVIIYCSVEIKVFGDSQLCKSRCCSCEEIRFVSLKVKTRSISLYSLNLISSHSKLEKINPVLEESNPV